MSGGHPRPKRGHFDWNSLVVLAPLRTSEPSLFLYDRKVNNEFRLRNRDSFKIHFPGFQFAKKIHYQNNNVAMEVRIPRYTETLSYDTLAGKGIYFTVGYNDPNGEDFLWYQWSKHFKQVECIENENIGPCGPEKKAHFSPQYPREGWGQLYFHEKMITVDSFIAMPWHLNIAEFHPGVNPVEKQREKRIMKAGSKIHFPELNGSQLKIVDQKGRVLRELKIQSHQIDLDGLQFDPGYYFGLIGDRKFSFIYGL